VEESSHLSGDAPVFIIDKGIENASGAMLRYDIIVGGLLHLSEEDASTDGMDTTCREVEDISRMTRIFLAAHRLAIIGILFGLQRLKPR
jgi:hypothetical protein